jgi:hypothetical protein
MHNGIWGDLTKTHLPAGSAAAISKLGGCASLYLLAETGLCA